VLGAPVNFSVIATGSGPLSYQWRRNITPLAGATNDSFAISNVQTGDAGDYDVVVSNLASNTTSAAASLIVSVPPQLSSALVADGVARFHLSGTPGDHYMVESSTNFVDWAGSATMTNLSGSVLFTDPLPPTAPQKFYRGKLVE
jgi:hypothetical protein